MDRSTIWFTNNFYDGEGTSGVGAVGAFDVRTRRFEMRYLPEIAAWSGSAISLDGEGLWIGLMRQPEGAAFSGGLLHYNPGDQSKADPSRLGEFDWSGVRLVLDLLRSAFHEDDKTTHLEYEEWAANELSETSGHA
jgi:hypothetical protein